MKGGNTSGKGLSTHCPEYLIFRTNVFNESGITKRTIKVTR